MAKQDSIQDNNQFPAMLAHTGTSGTAETIRVVASDAGALRVDLVSGDSINIGTMTVGTIDNLTKGTITRLEGGSVVVTAGTVSTLNTIGTVGVVNGGSIVVTAGTVTTAMGDISGGTIDILTAGSIVMTAGTVSTLNTVGTVGVVNAGSVVITAGTVKLDGRLARNILTYGTSYGGTAAGYGTLIGSAVVGVGTAIYVNDLSIVNQAGTVDCLVGFGTALSGASVLAKGKFAAQGGIQKSYPLAVNAGLTNQDLVCYVGAAGTIDVNVSYFIA